MFYWMIWGLARVLFFFRARLIATGIENIPKKGSLILVANHISGFDPIAIGLCVSKRRLRYMAKIELYRFFLFGWFLRGIGVFPVKRDEITKDFLKLTFSILRSEQALLIFGEGTRNRSNQPLLPLKPGFAYLAENAPAPVIPVFISGSRLITSWKIRPTIRIQFGEIIPPGPRQSLLTKTESSLTQFAGLFHEPK